MSKPLLVLGPFSFEDLESPDRIHVTTKQRLAVHHLGSGYSAVDYLGEDLATISFRGIFSGVNAADRIRSIDYLRLQGAPLVLSWNARTLSVIIKEFELDYSSDRWIPYGLTCYVVQSGNLGAEDPTALMSASPGMQVSEALGLLNGAGLNPTSDQVDALLTLTTLNFDTPPSAALGLAQELTNSINEQLTVLSDCAQSELLIDPDSSIDEVSYMAALVTNYGQQAALTLGYNRVMSVLMCAEDVGQP